MNNYDFSMEIYDKYFGTDDRLVRITLKDNSVLEGKFIGFFRAENREKSFVEKWHFVVNSKMESDESAIASNETGFAEPGNMEIHQDNIMAVEFIDNQDLNLS